MRARLPGGYHALETIFAFADAGDMLRAEAADKLSLEVVGPFAAELEHQDNLVLRVADAMRGAFGVREGARLTLTKRLPVAAGLGGGSADAAAALRLLARLWHVDPKSPEIARIAAAHGADIPACLLSRTCLGRARGDELEPIEPGPLAGMPVLIVNPGVPLATGAVFRAHGGTDGGPLAPGDPLTRALGSRNDLEAPARALCPEVGEVIACLEEAGGATLVRMSGSGASVFALYPDIAARNSAAATLAMRESRWWCMAARLR